MSSCQVICSKRSPPYKRGPEQENSGVPCEWRVQHWFTEYYVKPVLEERNQVGIKFVQKSGNRGKEIQNSVLMEIA